MLGDSAVLGTGGGSSGDAVAGSAVAAASGGAHEGADVAAGGGGGSNSGDDERGRGEEGDKSFGGNRWPRQETLALLKIRSDMDVAFRDASVKGPLWEEVSRKLAELGYHRNAKKCKEKFENVYKYHKRTKEGRSGKSEGKTYRFFDQLEALENNPAIQSPTPTSKPPLQTIALPATPVSIVASSASSLPLPTTTVPLQPVANNTTTIASTTTLPMAVSQGILNIIPSTINITTPSYPSSNPTYFTTPTPNPTSKNPPNTINPSSFPNIPTDLLSNSSSSSTSSEETLEGGGTRRKRKRKWKDFFERLMKEVIEKQEELQRRFLEAIEKREHERVAREEAWRMQEMQRINREREILAHERSIAAAKDAAVMAFLQKIAEQQQQQINLEPALNNNNNINIVPPVQQATTAPTTVQQTQTTAIPEAPPAQSLAPQQQHHQVHQQQQQVVTNVEIVKADNNGENLMMGTSSSRWPKVEVQELINLRTSLETKYQESGPKGPLWEEISTLMKKMGYNRSAKRCKEKWENINKYFKKVKESNKKRPEDSKTCPYFHLLEALYREKNKGEGQMKPESMMAPLMVPPEQQWPPQHAAVPEVTMEDAQNDPMDLQHHNEEDEDEEMDKEIGDDDEDEDDDGGDNYEIVARPFP
ncbi:trihelix transcription factor GT-2-like isoform X2 [Abrus precatorius]|uniref:Trihelix transcription factor GT-2-like isoform X2 n=1 Tax=Abrus precatorius TaxID=3816 RepID=A0A8B8LRG1_ABRPR|nr:trihelix transcription factor GT-2-like isoform X2 [Abrus precatorius]